MESPWCRLTPRCLPHHTGRPHFLQRSLLNVRGFTLTPVLSSPSKPCWLCPEPRWLECDKTHTFIWISYKKQNHSSQAFLRVDFTEVLECSREGAHLMEHSLLASREYDGSCTPFPHLTSPPHPTPSLPSSSFLRSPGSLWGLYPYQIISSTKIVPSLPKRTSGPCVR